MIDPQAVIDATIDIVEREGDLLVTAWPSRMAGLFPELVADGERWCGVVHTPEVWFLICVSDEVAALWGALMGHPRLCFAPAHPLAYAFEGAPMYNLPAAHGDTLARGSTTPHWAMTRLVLREGQGHEHA